ncbi:MAG TPA: hypothetical protein PKY81_12570 [bacterium]|nr:hypothetical protein [bacterium]HPN31781.1 hypothetical protein [bacterium]
MKHLISIPLFDKNIKSIYRSKSSERLITFFSLFALCLIVNKIFIVYDPYSLSNRICWFMGESIFLSVFGIQAIITIIAGFITGGAVFSSEREQLTYDILMTSPLSKKTIIDTSLLSTIMPFITIMFISLPLFAIAYFLGGVSVKVISDLIIMNFAALLVFTMFGMSFSVSSKKTFNATLIVIFFPLVCFL